MTRPLAVVVGSSGGIGGALTAALAARGAHDVVGFSRGGEPSLDLLDEASIAGAAASLQARGAPIRLVVLATGVLSGEDFRPERTLAELDPMALSRLFAINAVGPALVMKHFLPLAPREGRSVFAALSARVGSIGDNRLGGWYGYRASKAALNQLIRTASVELRRTRREAICVGLHPGTVDTALSRPFAKAGLAVRPPTEAAGKLLTVLDELTVADTGQVFDADGLLVPW